MTKKSHARLQRDHQARVAKKHLENNTCWDDLNNIYNECCKLLAQHTMLKEAFTPELIQFVPDKATTIELIQLLTNDVTALSTDLSNLKALHADKKGGADNPDTVIHTIQIFEQYNLFIERHQAVVMPTSLQILEQLQLAEKAQGAAQQAYMAETKVTDNGDGTNTIDVQATVVTEAQG